MLKVKVIQLVLNMFTYLIYYNKNNHYHIFINLYNLCLQDPAGQPNADLRNLCIYREDIPSVSNTDQSDCLSSNKIKMVSST